MLSSVQQEIKLKSSSGPASGHAVDMNALCPLL